MPAFPLPISITSWLYICLFFSKEILKVLKEFLNFLKKETACLSPTTPPLDTLLQHRPSRWSLTQRPRTEPQPKGHAERNARTQTAPLSPVLQTDFCKACFLYYTHIMPTVSRKHFTTSCADGNNSG